MRVDLFRARWLLIVAVCKCWNGSCWIQRRSMDTQCTNFINIRTTTSMRHKHQPEFRNTVTIYRAETQTSDSSRGNDFGKWDNKDIYQRVFYRFSPGSDISDHDAIVVEERCRYIMDPQRPEYIIPIGQRKLILRNGRVDDGEIGDDFFTIEVAGDEKNSKAHNGAGNDQIIQGGIACALYLASNPDLCLGRILELSAESGLGSLLGCIGAGHNIRMSSSSDNNDSKDITDDVLTISKKHDTMFPPDLDILIISDVDEDRLTMAFNNVKSIGSSSKSKVTLDVVDWRTHTIRPRGGNSMKSNRPTDFHTVVASDIDFSYPETKLLAKTVAHRLEPTAQYIYKPGSSLPRFVHVCKDERDDVIYLRRILEKGYRMITTTKYLKLEKLVFHLQTLNKGEPESALDDLDLELKEFKEIKYQALLAQHHPDYAGGGSGELFFPLETGEYDVTGGSSFLEKEIDSNSW